MIKITHFIVIKSPYAQQILDGTKVMEYRGVATCKALSGKYIAIAVSRSPQVEESGFIVGIAKFGFVDYKEEGVFIESFIKFERNEWVFCRGGLGVKPIGTPIYI